MLHGVTALALIAVVLSVALGAANPQIGVAEFAPSARKTLEAPPSTDSDAKGGGVARGGRRSTTTTAVTSTAPSVAGDEADTPTTRVSRSRTCVGEPPRQIEDPMSPPCMATIFEGDNGGATSRGVTATSIRIAIPGYSSTLDSERSTLLALIEFFNRHFEFYGRRLEPVFVPTTSFDQTPTMNRALAADLAAKDVFALNPGTLERNGLANLPLYRELARDRVISVTSNMAHWLSDALVYDELHPFVWSAYPSAEQIWRNYVDFACTALVGHQAIHANDPNLRTKTRKFGILASTFWTTPSTALPQQGIEACGGQIAVASVNVRAGNSDQVRTALQKFKDAGVTTVSCACPWDSNWSLVAPAKAVGFGPEWITLAEERPSGLDDLLGLNYEGQSGAFMLSWRERILPYQARPWFQALMETAPNLTSLTNADQLFSSASVGTRSYLPLLILATGIQAAGPTLTPETFAAGLMSTQFANPGAGQSPYWQPSVGFGPGDHTFINDYALAWWEPSLPGFEVQQGIPGSLCYLDRGARFHPGTWPADTDQRILDRNAPCR